MTRPKPFDHLADSQGVTLRDKLVILGFVDAQGPIDLPRVFHQALDVMLEDRAIRKPTHAIRT